MALFPMLPIKSGVLQGSILSPSLSSLYVDVIMDIYVRPDMAVLFATFIWVAYSTPTT